jgi:hypothetical protein
MHPVPHPAPRRYRLRPAEGHDLPFGLGAPWSPVWITIERDDGARRAVHLGALSTALRDTDRALEALWHSRWSFALAQPGGAKFMNFMQPTNACRAGGGPSKVERKGSCGERI